MLAHPEVERMSGRAAGLAFLAWGFSAWGGAKSLGAQGAPLLVLQDNFPRAFFFRSSESQAANPNNSYEEWDATFRRLMGIEGKVFDEEVPGRMARNPQFFAQFKLDHPNQLVMLHFNGRARDPLFETSNYFAGHWIYFNGATISADAPAESGETDIHVSNANLFKTNIGRYGTSNDDIGLCRLDAQGKPDWSQSEQVQLVSVDSAAGTIRVRRGQYATAPRAFPANASYAAAHVTEGPWGAHSNLIWFYNHSTVCPLDANGKTCDDVLTDELAARFAPGGLLEAFDGLEFDVLMHNVGNSSALRGPDCDADGVKDAGAIGGLNVYGAGVIEFCRALRQKMGEGKLIMADGHGQGHQRAMGILNGIESEGWPSLNDAAVEDWSGGLNRHFFWEQNGRAPVFNYINHKFMVPGGTGQQQEVPYSTHRLVFAAGHFVDAAICYSYTPPKSAGELVGIWDELWKGTAQEIGWLGPAVGPARRLASEQPDVFNGAGSPATSEILAKFSGAKMNFAIDNGRVKVTALSGATQLDFYLNGVPGSGPDLYLAVGAHGDPLPGYPADMPRLMTVETLDGVATPTKHMTWVNGQDFASTFYYGDVNSSSVRLRFTIEGTGPIWLTLTGHAHPDAIVREFEHGAVVANPSLHDYVFDLASLFPGRHFRRFQGTALQDPATNNGAPVFSPLTIPSKDALFLVKRPSSPANRWTDY